ncbi:hypothetical protein [Lachnospira pectinoschiza]|uniref:ABC-2 type transport system permease protein n=1 Tax=Lachnospira pectinoschiza TaxID=28052 RepID=A0A1G9WW62_9FIRM|nr:hypothetical protein [Lachnospira pectinoschiza]SDM88416.1 ABC-2 type transport system permease protein [Lachnospira pectinoschiza]
MNNKRIFSFNLFKQTFSQLKSVGIIGMIGVLFISFTIVFDLIQERLRYNLGKTQADYEYSKAIVTGLDENRFLVVLIPLLVIAFSLIVWHFLNQRASSDFYHSLPYTRLALYLSRFMAGVAWLLLILLVNMLVQLVSFILYKDYLLVDYNGMLLMHLSLFIYGFQALCAFALACALTGNIISNILTAGIIVFLPRFITTIVFSFINTQTILRVGEVPGLLNNIYNFDVAFVFKFIGVGRFDSFADIVSNPGTYIYSILLSLIYLVLGAIAFNKRKSEYAGKGAISRVVRFIIRAAIVVALNVYSVARFINLDRSIESFWEIVATFLISVVILGIYEFIASKRVASIIKAIPSLIVGIVVTVGISLCINMTVKNINNYTPTTDNVKNVSISIVGNNYSFDASEYTGVITENIKITNEEVIDILIDAYNRTKKKALKSDTRNYYITDEGYTAVEVQFNSSIIKNKRIVWLTNSDVENIASSLADYKDYQKAFDKYPDVDEASFEYDSVIDNLTSTEIKNVYQTAVEELKVLDFKDVYIARVKGSSTNVQAYFSKNGKKYKVIIPITQEYTPKALALVMNYCNEDLNEQEEIRSGLADILETYVLNSDTNNIYDEYYLSDTSSYYDIYFTDYKFPANEDMESKALYLEDLEENDGEYLKAIIDALRNGNEITNVDSDDEFIGLNITHMVYDSEYENYYCDEEYYFYVRID